MERNKNKIEQNVLFFLPPLPVLHSFIMSANINDRANRGLNANKSVGSAAEPSPTSKLNSPTRSNESILLRTLACTTKLVLRKTEFAGRAAVVARSSGVCAHRRGDEITEWFRV